MKYFPCPLTGYPLSGSNLSCFSVSICAWVYRWPCLRSLTMRNLPGWHTPKATGEANVGSWHSWNSAELRPDRFPKIQKENRKQQNTFVRSLKSFESKQRVRPPHRPMDHNKEDGQQEPPYLFTGRQRRPWVRSQQLQSWLTQSLSTSGRLLNQAESTFVN